MIPGELRILLQRCRAEDTIAWEHLAAWVRARSRAVLGGVQKLSDADREDAVADTLKSLVTAIRRDEIRGASNAEIDAYVGTAIRNRALNVLRGRARRREVSAWATEAPDSHPPESPVGDEVPDEAPRQDTQVIAAEQLVRAEKLLLSWPPEDRYLFIAKLNGASATVIKQTLERPPFDHFTAVTTVDTRFHRLRKRMIEHIREP